ncbi:MAG: MBL fold metallo-hydrolase [Theionarchaea archaeon]|nr:MBL fold metallo-hydrolase [Theionarchaea archaeon]
MNAFTSLSLRFTTVFFLECDGGVLQIDTGYKKEYTTYVQTLDTMGFALSEITYLLLTHHHDDHAGFAQALLQDSGAKLIVHEHALPFIRTGTVDDVGEYVNWCIRLLGAGFFLFHNCTYPPISIRKTDRILEGDSSILRDCGIPGQIVYTPGHTTDSISVIVGDNAFVGDAAMNFFNFCHIQCRPIIIQNTEQVYQSWNRIISCGVKTIYPAHGGSFSVDRLKRAHEKFKKKL